ncbi:MAG: protein kinase family protein [Actinomycetia bacterium]|nr:protein kinase family protein [Actinomycetes bacterium]
MTNNVVGISGIDLPAGDHICAFYRGPNERNEILLPFLRQGLDDGDKSICVIESIRPDEMLAALGEAPGESDRPGRLDLMTPEQTYLRGGRFSMPAMLEYWRRGVESALAESRYRFVRVVGEMPRALVDKADLDEFLAYESELNRFAPCHPQTILCLYDLDRFSAKIFLTIMRTHPVVLLSGTVLENPYYLDPDEFLADRKPTSVSPAPPAAACDF